MKEKEKFEKVTFDLQCTMKQRWVPYFLGMLGYMQQLGGLGGSRKVTFYSDGDGDFRPNFIVNGKPIKEVVDPLIGVIDEDGNKFYDAG